MGYDGLEEGYLAHDLLVWTSDRVGMVSKSVIPLYDEADQARQGAKLQRSALGSSVCASLFPYRSSDHHNIISSERSHEQDTRVYPCGHKDESNSVEYCRDADDSTGVVFSNTCRISVQCGGRMRGHNLRTSQDAHGVDHETTRNRVESEWIRFEGCELHLRYDDHGQQGASSISENASSSVATSVFDPPTRNAEFPRQNWKSLMGKANSSNNLHSHVQDDMQRESYHANYQEGDYCAYRGRHHDNMLVR